MVPVLATMPQIEVTLGSRESLPDAAFAVVVGGQRLFPHHDGLAIDGDDNTTVDRALLRRAVANVSLANVSAEQKADAWAHLAAHAAGLDPPMQIGAAPAFANGPQAQALLMRSDGDGDVAMSSIISDDDRASLEAALNTESGRPTTWIQVIGTGKRLINGSWVEVVEGDESDRDTGRVGLDTMVSTFREDRDRGVKAFVDYGHAHSNRQADYISEMSAGDILDVEARDGALWANVRWTPRAARSILDGEFNLTSIHFRWFGVDNLADPPVARGAFFINFALTNNPAWQGQEPASMAVAARTVVDGGATIPDRCSMTRGAVVRAIDLEGGTLDSFMDSLDEAIQKAAIGGLFGSYDLSRGPCIHATQVKEGEAVIANCDAPDNARYTLIEWSRTTDGTILLTKPRRAVKTYVAAKRSDTDMNIDALPDIAAPVESDAVVALRASNDALETQVADLNAKLATVTADDGTGVVALRDEVASLRTSNADIAKRLMEAELSARDGQRDAAMSRCKQRGLPDAMLNRASGIFDSEGPDGLESFMSDLDSAGALVPVGKRTGHGHEPDAADVAAGDKRGEAWRRIDAIRTEAKDAGSPLSNRDALAKLRDEATDLYDALGLPTRVDGSRK